MFNAEPPAVCTQPVPQESRKSQASCTQPAAHCTLPPLAPRYWLRRRCCSHTKSRKRRITSLRAPDRWLRVTTLYDTYACSGWAGWALR